MGTVWVEVVLSPALRTGSVDRTPARALQRANDARPTVFMPTLERYKSVVLAMRHAALGLLRILLRLLAPQTARGLLPTLRHFT